MIQLEARIVRHIAENGRSPQASSRALLAIATIAGGLCAVLPGVALAEPTISIEPRGEIHKVPGASVTGGPAIGVDGGWSLDLEPILVVPEIRLVTGVAFPGSDTLVDFRAMGGVRVGLAGPVEPSVFVHLGYGLVSDGNLSNFASFDCGLALDYRAKRWFTIGGALGYQLLGVSGTVLHSGYIAPRVGFWFE